MNKPKVIIVDESDTPIGLKYRNEIDYTKDTYRCTGIWITNSKGEVLIAQRAFIKDKDPGKWGPAIAGTLEESEDYESNAYKEAHEELGLSGITLTLGPKEHITKPRKYFGQWFFCTVDKPLSDFTIQKEEVEQIAWIDKDELKTDIENNPDKYTHSLGRVMNMFL